VHQHRVQPIGGRVRRGRPGRRPWPSPSRPPAPWRSRDRPGGQGRGPAAWASARPGRRPRPRIAPCEHGDPALGAGGVASVRASGARRQGDLAGPGLLDAIGAQFGRGGGEAGGGVLQSAHAGLDFAAGRADRRRDRNRASRIAAAADRRIARAGAQPARAPSTRPRAPPRRAPRGGEADEAGLDGVDVLHQPGRRLAARQGQGLRGRRGGQGSEQHRPDRGQGAQGGGVAAEALQIARAGAQDGQQADRGAGQQDVEGLGGARPAAPAKAAPVMNQPDRPSSRVEAAPTTTAPRAASSTASPCLRRWARIRVWRGEALTPASRHGRPGRRRLGSGWRSGWCGRARSRRGRPAGRPRQRVEIGGRLVHQQDRRAL
jgi:hypothetical protein